MNSNKCVLSSMVFSFDFISETLFLPILKVKVSVTTVRDVQRRPTRTLAYESANLFVGITDERGHMCDTVSVWQNTRPLYTIHMTFYLHSILTSISLPISRCSLAVLSVNEPQHLNRNRMAFKLDLSSVRQDKSLSSTLAKCAKVSGTCMMVVAFKLQTTIFSNFFFGREVCILL